MIEQEKFWGIFDRDGIIIMLLVVPLALFLLTGYLKEDLVSMTMPIFLCWNSVLTTLLAIHAIKRRVFQFFDRGPVFAGETPISFWILVTVELLIAILLFSVTTIYIVDTIS